jgi:hypothetical protein
LANIHLHVFVDTDYKIKRTKSLMEKTVLLINSNINLQDDNIVILLSKPILEDKVENNIVITTINKK